MRATIYSALLEVLYAQVVHERTNRRLKTVEVVRVETLPPKEVNSHLPDLHCTAQLMLRYLVNALLSD